MVEFRWAALIALWSMLVGPIFDLSAPASPKAQSRAPRPAQVRGR